MWHPSRFARHLKKFWIFCKKRCYMLLLCVCFSKRWRFMEATKSKEKWNWAAPSTLVLKIMKPWWSRCCFGQWIQLDLRDPLQISPVKCVPYLKDWKISRRAWIWFEGAANLCVCVWERERVDLHVSSDHLKCDEISTGHRQDNMIVSFDIELHDAGLAIEF